jgi:hypothetical protein
MNHPTDDRDDIVPTNEKISEDVGHNHCRNGHFYGKFVLILWEIW